MPKTVLITGASSGIGRAAATRFAREGWNVAATMRSPGAADGLAAIGNVLTTRLDVEDRGSIDKAVALTLNTFGAIDVLVNNAGFALSGVFESFAAEKIRQQFDVNVLGVMDVTRAVLPHMRAQKSGTIIMVSSRAGLIGLPMNSLYCASKWALEGWSEAVSFELASIGIAVKIVEPRGGITETKFGDRVGAEARPANVPSDYGNFVAGAMKAFGSMLSAAKTSSDDVAGTIFTAATDGKDTLRYVIGTDNPPLMQARREMSEDDYIRFVRKAFAPPK